MGDHEVPGGLVSDMGDLCKERDEEQKSTSIMLCSKGMGRTRTLMISEKPFLICPTGRVLRKSKSRKVCMGAW
jgi:hypothetical protein